MLLFVVAPEQGGWRVPRGPGRVRPVWTTLPPVPDGPTRLAIAGRVLGGGQQPDPALGAPDRGQPEERLRELLAPSHAEEFALGHVEGLALSPAEGAAGGKAIILLRGCGNVNQCHRKLLAERLADAWSADVVHLTPPTKNAPPGQKRLF